MSSSEAGKTESGSPEFGSELRRLRLLSKRSQEDLAREVGVDPTTVSHWEKSVNWPTKEHFAAILRVLAPEKEDEQALKDAWHGAHGERRADPPTSALQELIVAVEQVIGESRRDPRDREYQLVKRVHHDNLRRRLRQLKRHHSDG